MTNSYKNIVRLKAVATALASLDNKVVFVGGAVVDLYADDPARGEVRPTDDIDVVIEIVNRGTFSELEERLRDMGFRNDVESGIICRYRFHDIVVDIMPDDASILGFSNNWYKPGLQNRDIKWLDECKLHLLSLGYFLATKFEALKSERHGKDYRWNSDFEDIIYIFDNRKDILNELDKTDLFLNNYLKNCVMALLNRPFISEEIMANLAYSSQDFRKNRIVTIWKNFTHEL